MFFVFYQRFICMKLSFYINFYFLVVRLFLFLFFDFLYHCFVYTQSSVQNHSFVTEYRFECLLIQVGGIFFCVFFGCLWDTCWASLLDLDCLIIKEPTASGGIKNLAFRCWLFVLEKEMSQFSLGFI